MLTERSGCVTAGLVLHLMSGLGLAYALYLALHEPVHAEPVCNRDQFGHRQVCNE